MTSFITLLFAKSNYNVEAKDDEIDRACRTIGGENECV
jgi:hypothetical protein